MYAQYRSTYRAVEVYLIGVYPIEVYHIGKGAVEISGLPLSTHREAALVVGMHGIGHNACCTSTHTRKNNLFTVIRVAFLTHQAI